MARSRAALPAAAAALAFVALLCLQAPSAFVAVFSPIDGALSFRQKYKCKVKGTWANPPKKGTRQVGKTKQRDLDKKKGKKALAEPSGAVLPLASAAPAPLTGATFVPSLLLAARVTVSVVHAGARALRMKRAAKAPISEYRAPEGARNFQEMVLGFTGDIAKNNLGESLYRPWVPYVTTIFLFIFVSNWSGALVPWKLLALPEGELAAPTNNINTTVALSLLTSIAYFGGGLVKKGLGYFARYVKPTPILLPINILEDFTKPLSLSFRLFGNVLADELTVAVLTFLVPFFIPLPIMGLGVCWLHSGPYLLHFGSGLHPRG